MSLTVAVVALPITATLLWARAVLVDESLYLRSVAPSASSPTFARLAGMSVSMAARHRGRPLTVSRRIGPALGRITTWTMGRPGFRPTWVLGHRLVHRHRGSARTAVAMLGLAAMGLLFGMSSRVRPPRS